MNNSYLVQLPAWKLLRCKILCASSAQKVVLFTQITRYIAQLAENAVYRINIRRDVAEKECR